MHQQKNEYKKCQQLKYDEKQRQSESNFDGTNYNQK